MFSVFANFWQLQSSSAEDSTHLLSVSSLVRTVQAVQAVPAVVTSSSQNSKALDVCIDGSRAVYHISLSFRGPQMNK